MRGFPTGGNISRLAGKGVFGPTLNQNIQVFGAAGGTWNKPAGKIVQIQFIAVGPGGGANGGAIVQASASGIGAVTSGGGGAGGGFCIYTPSVALVPASVVITGNSGGLGGAAQTVSGSFVGNGNGGNPGFTSAGGTNVGGGVIVCNAGTGSGIGQKPGGTATCTGAWGGAFTTQTGGRGGGGAQFVVNSTTYPTNAQRQVFTVAPASPPSGSAGESPTLAPGGGGALMEWGVGPGSTRFEASCWGGAAGGGIGGAPGNDVNTDGIAGPAIPSTTVGNGQNGGNFQGGGCGGNIFFNPSSSPAGNLYTMICGNGGNGGPGAGGGNGGSFSILLQVNSGTVTAGAGGNGGDSQVVVIVTFG